MPLAPVAVVLPVLFCGSITTQKLRQTLAVFAVTAFDTFVAAAVAAVFVGVDMFALVLCHVVPPVIPL